MTTTPVPTEDEAVETVHAAITRGVEGDVRGGAELLYPLMTSGRGTAYALVAMLAETASHIARRDQMPGFFTIAVDGIEAGEGGPTDDLLPAFAFAADFVTAWANRDYDMAEALFKNLVNTSRSGGEEVVDAVIVLFQMAVVTAAEIVHEQRAARDGRTGEEPTT